MTKKPTYEELEQRVKELEKEAVVRKRAREALRDSEEKWHSLVENAPGFIIEVNRYGKIQFINRGVPGIGAKEAIGQSMYKYIEPAYQNTARETIKEVFKTGKPRSYVVKALGPDGHHLAWYETQVGPIRHGSRVVAAILITTDITDHKQADEALKESEQKYRTLTENSLTGVSINQDGKIVFVNDRFAQIHGYKREELLGKHHLTLIHPDHRELVEQRVSQRLKGQAVPRRYEIKRLRKDGEAIWCEIMVTRTQYRGKPAIMGNTVDISERKKAEEALREREVELEIKSKSLEEMNTALRVLLERRDEDSRELEKKVVINVKELVVPFLERVKNTHLDPGQMACIRVLESNLNNIISPFTRALSAKYLELTPTEIHIANLIREGTRNKVIAKLMNLSIRTIEFHRENIRKKFDIKNRKTNLRTHLLSLH